MVKDGRGDEKAGIVVGRAFNLSSSQTEPHPAERDFRTDTTWQGANFEKASSNILPGMQCCGVSVPVLDRQRGTTSFQIEVRREKGFAS